MLFISDGWSPEDVDYVGPNSPRVCSDDVVHDAELEASEGSAAGAPLELLQNPQTNPGERWQSPSTAEQTVTIELGGQAIDYLAIAKHNLNGMAVQVEYTAPGDSEPTILSGNYQIADKQAIIILFRRTQTTNLTLRILPQSTRQPEIGVLYAGASFGIPHRIYQGVTPITLGKNVRRLNHVADSGHYLGTLILAEWYSFSAEFQHLDAGWVRDVFRPFRERAKLYPFFFAWRPQSYASEVGYAWLTSIPQPQNTGPGNFMSLSMEMRLLADDE